MYAEGLSLDEMATRLDLSKRSVQRVTGSLGLRYVNGTQRRPGDPLPSIEHGTPGGYKRCGPPKCEKCQAMQARYMRRRRSRG
jgi:hypothetical protein